jgi:hypothetical protein
LASFIVGFKAAVTSRVGHELNTANIWQRNYYGHIIRNKIELQNIRNYIDTNPLRWQVNQLHLSASPNRFIRVPNDQSNSHHRPVCLEQHQNPAHQQLMSSAGQALLHADNGLI